MCSGLILHLTAHYFMYKLNLFIIIQQYYSYLYLENQCILIVGTFYQLAVLGRQRILVVLVLNDTIKTVYSQEAHVAFQDIAIKHVYFSYSIN